MRWFSWYLFGTVHCIQKCYWLLCVDFCILQRPNLLVLNNFLVEFLWFSIYKIMPSANRNDLTSFLLIWMHFFLSLASLFWLGLLVPPWMDVMSVGILVLFVILEEKLSTFASMTWPVGLVYMDFIVLRDILCQIYCYFFKCERMLKIVKWLFCVYWGDHMVCPSLC